MSIVVNDAARSSKAVVGIVVSVALLSAIPGCGSAGGRAAGRALARAAATVAIAAVAEAAQNRRARRRNRNQQDDTDDWPEEPPGLEVSEPFEVFEYDTLITEERRPLPLDRSLAVIEIDPEVITCDSDSDCEVLVVGCCSCAEGGAAMAVRGEMIEELREDIASECDAGCSTPGPERITCTSQSACIHGLCRLIDDRPPEPDDIPPVPEPPPA